MKHFTKPSRLVVLFFATILCSAAKAQVFNCYEGQGVLENNWNDRSWCTDTLQSGDYVYSGGANSVKITYTTGWQGFALGTNLSFQAGYFSALTFVINGGTTSGRSIEVQLLANGAPTNTVNLNNYIQGGSVAANTWRQVTIPLSAFGLLPTDLLTQFALQDSSGHAQASYYIDQIKWVPTAPPSVVNISVAAGSSGRTVDQKLFGVNTALWNSGFSSTTCKTLVSAAGYKAFRFPGGSASDTYHWATNTSIGNPWTWVNSFDTFASVAVPASNGQCFITTNYGSGTAAEAAAWVQYSNVTNHYGMKYWEVGNEVFGSWEADSHAMPHDPVTYAQQFAQYYQAMKAVDPTIQVGAVASIGEDAYANYPGEAVSNPVTGVQHSGWTPVMLATLARLGVTPDFLAYHRYVEHNVDSDFTLLQSNTSWATDVAGLRTQLVDYLGAANARVQIMCTENNADSGTEGKQLCSLVNGVGMADSFGSILQTECNSFVWWNLISGQSSAGENSAWLYGWRMYGDEGVMSPDFTQIYPVYYIEKLLNVFAAPGDTVVPTTSSYGLLSVYTTKRSDGTVRMLVVNKHPAAALTGSFHITGFQVPSMITEYSYGMPQDNAAASGLPQTITPKILISTSLLLNVSFAPYSVTVLVFNKRGSLQ